MSDDLQDLDRDVTYWHDTRNMGFGVEYDDVTGAGWILILSTQWCTSEHPIPVYRAEEIVRTQDLSPRDE